MKKAYLEPTITVISLTADKNLAADAIISDNELIFDSEGLE